LEVHLGLRRQWLSAEVEVAEADMALAGLRRQWLSAEVEVEVASADMPLAV
jgi:hypothetical protein